MAVITAAAGGGNWTAGGSWQGGVAPTAADDAVLDATSGNVTINGSPVCRSLTCTGYTGTLTHNSTITLAIGDGTAGAGNAALTLSAGMTYTLNNATSSAISFVSTSATQQTITTAGKTLGNVTFNGSTGSWLLADALTSGGNFIVSAGTANTGSQTVTCAIFNINGATAVGTLGASTINLTSTTAGANVFLRTNSGTFTAGAATFNIVNATANSRNFAAGSSGLSQATLNYTLAGSTGTLAFTSTVNLGTLNVSDASNARTVSFLASTTFTFGTFNVQGSAAGLISVVSATGGTPASLSKPSRVVSCDYLSIQDITATGGACWYAGANSVSVSGNTGWMFTAPSNTQFLQFA